MDVVDVEELNSVMGGKALSMVKLAEEPPEL